MPVTEAQKRATAKYEKENYDKVLVRFPKGTKERIQNAGAESVNSYIIRCVLDSLGAPQETPPEPLKQENERFAEEANRRKLLQMQAEIEAKKAEQDTKAAELQQLKDEQEQQLKDEYTAELVGMVEKMRNGEPLEEDAEKEKVRQESIVKASLPYK